MACFERIVEMHEGEEKDDLVAEACAYLVSYYSVRYGSVLIGGGYMGCFDWSFAVSPGEKRSTSQEVRLHE